MKREEDMKRDQLGAQETEIDNEPALPVEEWVEKFIINEMPLQQQVFKSSKHFIDDENDETRELIKYYETKVLSRSLFNCLIGVHSNG